MSQDIDQSSASHMLRLMRPPRVRQQVLAYAIGVGGTLALVAVFLPFRDDIDPLTKGFGFLVVVVAAAGIGGSDRGSSRRSSASSFSTSSSSLRTTRS